MERYYTVSQIAHKLSVHGRSRMVSEDAVYGWVRQGKLHVERIPGNIRGVGKYPFWIDKEHLKAFLQELNYDVDRLFPDNE